MLLLATSKPDSKQGTQAKFLFREGQLHAVLTELWLGAGIIIKIHASPDAHCCPLSLAAQGPHHCLLPQAHSPKQVTWVPAGESREKMQNHSVNGASTDAVP